MKASCRSQAIFLIVLSAYPVVMGVNSVQKKPSSGKVNPLTMQKELIVALHHSLHTLGTAGLDIEDIGSQLWDTFTALPKHNGQDLNSSTMRYLAHSFFIKQFGWLIRGLDPNRKATLRTGNATLRKNGKISNITIPVNRNDIPGFLLQHWGRWFNSADDSIGMTAAVGFVALLGNLILHESEARLENSYMLNGFNTASNLPERDLESIIDSFMILFSFEEDNTRNKASHRADKEKIHQKWAKIGNATVEAIHSTEDFTNVAATQAASAVSKAAADGAVVSTLKYAKQVGEIAAAAAVTEPTPVPPVNATNATNATVVDPNAPDVTLTVTPGSTVRIDVQAAPAPAPAPAFFLQAYSEH